MWRDHNGNGQVHDYWFFATVVPNIRRRFEQDDRFCCVMALAKLWAVFDESASEDIPLAKTERIKHSFAMNFGKRDANPVVKVLLEVLNVDGCLEVVPVANNDVIANNANNNADNDDNDGNRWDDNEQEQPQQQQ
jgi:hypothetical protein